MAFVFPTRLIDSVNGMIGKVKIAVLRQVTLVGSKMTFLDQDGAEIDSVNITVDNVEGLSDLVGSESKTYDTFDEYEWFEGQSQTFTLTYKRNFIYAITVNGQTIIESQFEEDVNSNTFTILDGLDPTDFIRVVYNTEEVISEELPEEPTTFVDLKAQFYWNGTPVFGEDYMFYIDIFNNSTDTTATDVILQCSLPSGFVYASHNVPVGTYDPETGIWEVGNLDATSTKYITLTVIPTDTGEYEMNAEIYSNNEGEISPSDNSISEVKIPTYPQPPQVDLQLQIGVSENTVPTGSNVTFALIASNNTTTVPSTNTIVQLDIPSEFIYVSDNSGGTYNPVTGTWTIGDLNTYKTIEVVMQINTTAFISGIISSDQVDQSPSNNDTSRLITAT